MYKYCFLLLLCFYHGETANAGQEDSPDWRAVVPAAATTVTVVDEASTAASDMTELQSSLQRLKAECQALAAAEDTAKGQLPADSGAEGPETTKLRMRLAELVNRMSAGGRAKKPGEPPLSSPQPMQSPTDMGTKDALSKQKPTAHKAATVAETPEASEPGTPADPRALASVLFKAGKYELALKAYRLVIMTGMRADERAPLQYLMATCLRRMGKMEEAIAVYRDVANVRGDEQVAASAQWQIVNLRWISEFQAQLNDLQQRRKALEETP